MNGHVRAFVKKGLLFLLVARVVAAPIALRPASVNDPSQNGLVVRVCSWPVQHVRTASDKLTVGEGMAKPEADCPPPGSARLDILFSPCVRHGLSPSDAYIRRSIARLRC
ncbi:hypothetical protein V5E97_03645 [Singulisphaera sp. Ch08]|uniref:Uncharacterized protein n=1 Tax=Singulisphaera sp. Ch08 TaxID=3120278 RepID=A0AAU7CIN9_9BACT